MENVKTTEIIANEPRKSLYFEKNTQYDFLVINIENERKKSKVTIAEILYDENGMIESETAGLPKVGEPKKYTVPRALSNNVIVGEYYKAVTSGSTQVSSNLARLEKYNFH